MNKSYVMGGLAGFIAVSAIGGGIAILVGADRFPVQWLLNTAFTDYTIPAIILTVVVGGSALVASAISFTGGKLKAQTSIVAGLVMIIWIIAEVALINAPKPSPTELIYLALGVSLVGVAIYSRTRGTERKETMHATR